MNILIAAVGRLKGGPEAALLDDYLKRNPWPVQICEVDLRGGDAASRKEREGEKLLAQLPAAARVVALDEGGHSFASREFAAMLGAWRDQGVRDVAFLIGGADGLSDAAVARADRSIAFGALTWPHRLVRVMLAEQLYRAQSILAGHPYHRD